MSAVARLRQRLAGEQGFTLAELLVVLVTLGIVMGGLSAVFVSGMKAEVEAVERFDTQQQARLALGFLRREVHCASNAVVVTNAGSPPTQTLTLTLPSGCPTDPTATGQAIWCTVSLGTLRFGLYRVPSGACSSSGRLHADYLTTGLPFTYTIPSTTSLGVLDVNFPVDRSPSDTARAYTLQDRLILRNTAYT